jgi:hypothetical protein
MECRKMNVKRTLEELLLIYETERSLVDVFCEGPSDFLVFNVFVDAIDNKMSAVYAADQIEWPNGVGSHGGNRSRIVFLSNQLSSQGLNGICVVDKDFDVIEDLTPSNSALCKTDYSCTPMYGLEAADLQALIYSSFNLTITANQLSSVFEICKHLFAIRFLRDKHCMGSTIASPDNILTSPAAFAFSVQGYLDRCKQLNGYDARWDTVAREHDALFMSLQGDARDYINIHDLGQLLVAIIRALKSKSVSLKPDFVGKHCLYVSISQAQFGYPLFSELSSRLVR